MVKKININLNELAWFENSPDAGDPDCICSYCGFVISEDDDLARFFRRSDDNDTFDVLIPKCGTCGFLVLPEDDEWTQIFRKRDDIAEARLHYACLELLTN